jgi:hypothetical protein
MTPSNKMVKITRIAGISMKWLTILGKASTHLSFRFTLCLLDYIFFVPLIFA